MAIIDFHTHILPGIDDGSKDLETTIRMLKESKRQGVDIVYATPHFYADEENPESFLKKRAEAFAKLQEVYCREDMPLIGLGAEVHYFRGISHVKELGRLTMDQTKLLLLEMPYEPWSAHSMQEIREIQEEYGLKIVFAHLDRFLRFGENKRYIQDILNGPYYIQVNAASVIDGKRWRKISKWFKEKRVDFMGSDAHGMHHRVPNLGEAREILRMKFDSVYLMEQDLKTANILSEYYDR